MTGVKDREVKIYPKEENLQSVYESRVLQTLTLLGLRTGT